MVQGPHVNIFNLSYFVEGTKLNFSNFTYTFGQKKIGIVGDNGVGKTTLLKLIVGELKPNLGSVLVIGNLSYAPQDLSVFLDKTVGEVLAISDKLDALKRIEAGSINQIDFDLIGNAWDLERNFMHHLQTFGLSDISMDGKFGDLSGGQKTRIMLIKSMLSGADFIFWDEPTNNLDIDAKNEIYRFIDNIDTGLIVISHDRKLLEQMDEIIEITTMGINLYGGNYNDFLEQKLINTLALERQFDDASKAKKKAERTVQQTIERHDKKRANGRRAFLEGKIDRNMANSMRGRSERTQSRMNKQGDKMLAEANKKYNTIKMQMEVKEDIHAQLEKTLLPNGKMVIEVNNLSFAYSKKSEEIIKNFSFSLYGPERVAFLGKNGSGKTTLIKLLIGELEPVVGNIRMGSLRWSYLNQDISILDKSITVIENFKRLNPDESENKCYHALAQFNFRNKDAEKLVTNLSGGELIRAALACVLMSNTPPQLLILDEPTNHLDISSINALENIINQYCGALMVVSHDTTFLEKIHVEKFIEVNFVN